MTVDVAPEVPDDQPPDGATGAGHARRPVCAEHDRAIPPTPATGLGVISMVFWSITMVVSVKYVTCVMRADNEGEGGIMALIALIREIGAMMPPSPSLSARI